MEISLTAKAEERLHKIVEHQGQSPSEVIEHALELLEDYQRWEDEQDVAEMEAVKQEIQEEGTIPWETVKANLGR
ncbi:UNVERIFIED_CONTAM: elongation factor 1 delta (guanine nucleotide exchange protein) [Euhalothece sp. KZN 001]